MAFLRGILSTFISLNLVDSVLSYALCGINECFGYAAHCCIYDSEQCCYYYVYHFWWFWLVWVIIFTLIATCSVCCYRRRRRYYRTDYAIVSDAYRPPAYGTVVTVSAPPSYPVAQHQAATAPPSYQPEQKPPAYVP